MKWLLATVVITLLIPVGCILPQHNVSTANYTTLVVLPDTQKYSLNYPEIFKAQTQWIADNKESENIAYVLHTGDVVEESDNISQWQTAKEAMQILSSANVSYIVTPGNHDLRNNSEFFEQYFGAYQSYGLLDIGTEKVIIIAINGYARKVFDSCAWANSILAKYPDRKVILLTHGYLNDEGIIYSDPAQIGATIWHRFVVPNSNTFMVISGHYPGEEWSTTVRDDGTVAENLLANYQGRDNGGNGWLRLYRFDANFTKIDVLTYSPWLNRYETDADSQFRIVLSLHKAPAKPSPVVEQLTSVVASASDSPSIAGGGEGGLSSETVYNAK